MISEISQMTSYYGMQAYKSAKRVAVVSSAEIAGDSGRQRQMLFPCITREVSGSSRLSAGLVRMPGAGVSLVHRHVRSELIVVCFEGQAATLVGPELTVHLHGPGDFVFIPEGVPHVAVNLSRTEPVLAVEARTDPMFNDDVELLANLQPAAQRRALELQEAFALRLATAS